MPINSSDALINRLQAAADAIGAMASGLPDAQAIPLLSVRVAFGTPGSTIIVPGVGEKNTGIAWSANGVKVMNCTQTGAVLDVVIAKVNELVVAVNAHAGTAITEIAQGDLEP